MPAEPRRRRGLFKLAVAALAAVLLVAALDLYVVAVTRSAVGGDPAALAPRPYAMVLGNLVYPGGRPSAELVRRLETGLRVYRAGGAQRIIVSGRAEPSVDYDEPGAMAAWLEARGVPAAAVIADRGGYRTAASMADAAAGGVRSLIVVSQGYHLARAIYLARHAGIDAVGVAAPEARRTLDERGRLWLRETLARAEVVIEVAVRGVRGG